MRILTKAGVYGLRSILYLATVQDEEGYVSIRKISKEIDVPFHFLTKVFQDLSEAGFLSSSRGSRGGVRLAAAPEDIRFIDVVKALEGEDYFEGCVLALPQCSAESPCPLHAFWEKAKEELREHLETCSLASAQTKIQNGELHLI